MSKAGVKKHCSILNYLRQTDNDLYELIQDLCMGRIFIPRRNTPGVTFLHPDKTLLGKIKKMAFGDDPELAVQAIQSMVLLDYLPATSDFDDKKNDIPTFLRKKLPVASVSGSKVLLKNGAEVTIDKNFKTRSDRSNMAVYNLSKELVPTDTEPATFVNAKKDKNSKVKGGAVYEQKRKSLFMQILNACCDEKKGNRDPAMEALASLCDYLKGSNKTTELAVVQSQLSWDTLASLTIVMQPYKSGNLYLSDECILQWARVASYAGSSLFYYGNPVDCYKHNMEAAKTALSRAIPAITTIRRRVADCVAKTNCLPALAKAYRELHNLDSLPEPRRAVLGNGKQALAESELRVMSACLQDNTKNFFDYNEVVDLYTRHCTLDQPYILSSADQINASNIGFYFSTAYLIARSDALCYVPGIPGDVGLEGIAQETRMITLDRGMVDVNTLKQQYAAMMPTGATLEKLIAALTRLQTNKNQST